MTKFVLYIEFADDPPRVAVFDTFDEAEAVLDYFEVSVFDPSQNDGLLDLPFRARIFECDGVRLAFDYKDSKWGTEIDICAAREKMQQQMQHSIEDSSGTLLLQAPIMAKEPGTQPPIEVGPARSERYLDDAQMWEVTVTPPAWSGFKLCSRVLLTEDQHKRYSEWLTNGGLIQDVLEDLPAEFREQLQSGIHPKELDAMDPNDLRDCVEKEIKKLIEPVAWNRCEVVNRAEQESLRTVLGKWGTPAAAKTSAKRPPVLD